MSLSWWVDPTFTNQSVIINNNNSCIEMIHARELQLKPLQKRSRTKNSGFDGNRTQASHILGGRHYQLSYKAIFWEQANFGAFLLSTEESDHYLDKMN